MDLEVQSAFTGLFLLMEPPFKLFGSVRGSVIEDEGDRLHLTAQGFGNDVMLHKGLEIDKAFAASAGSVDLAISDGKPGKQMARAATMVTRFVSYRLAWACWARRLLAFTGLNGGFFIQTDQPGACLQECSCLSIGFEYRASSLEERGGIINMLPGMIPPGTNTFGSEPPTYRTGRDVGKCRVLGHAPS